MLRKSPLKPSTKPLARAPFRSRPKEPGAVRKTLKPKRPKMTPIRKSARGEECTLRLPVCNFDPATTVWAHSNRSEDGKGMGLKARDEEGCYACAACHSFLDGGYAGKMARTLLDTYFDLARVESKRRLKLKGLIDG